MRKIIVSNVITLDGYFEGPNQQIDWFITNDEFFDYAVKQLHEVGAILFGRVTYQQMAAFWPTPAGDQLPAIAEKMNSLPKFVFSKTLENADWNNSTIIKGNLAEETIKLKEQPGGDIVIFGSGQIVSALTQLGLINEYRIILTPAILGKGNSMFKGIENKMNLNLINYQIFKNGVMVLYYVPFKNKEIVPPGPY